MHFLLISSIIDKKNLAGGGYSRLYEPRGYIPASEN